MIALELFTVLCVSLISSLALVPVILRFARAFNLFDMPDNEATKHNESSGVSSSQTPRRIHTVAVPRLGGIAIFVGFFVSLLFTNLKTDLWKLYLASFVLFLTGFVDDIKPLSAKLRLFIQVAAAVFVVWTYNLELTTVQLTSATSFSFPYFVALAISVFIIVGAINAINMIDGLDGLASGVVLIGVLFLSYLHFLNTGDIQLFLGISVPLIGALLGFLKYNSHPATLFMGDCGSNWLGFMLGFLLLIVANEMVLVRDSLGVLVLSRTNTDFIVGTVPLVSVVMCLAVPVCDTAQVIISRLKNGLSPMAPDKRHFHHGLMRLGLSHSQTVATVYLFAMIVATLGVFPIAFPQLGLVKDGFWWVPYVASLLLVVCIPAIVHLDAKFLRAIWIQKQENESLVSPVGSTGSWLVQIWETLNRYVLGLICIATPLFAGVPSRATGIIAAIILFLLIASVLIPKRKIDFLDGLIITAAATIILIANNQNAISLIWNGNKVMINFIYNYAFFWLAASTVILFIVTARKRYFIVSPTDFLMLSLPLILLLVPDPYRTNYKLNIIGLRSLVLFATIRTMQKRHRANVHRLKMISACALAFIVCVSLFGLRVIY